MNKNRERYIARREKSKTKPLKKIEVYKADSDKNMDRFNTLTVFTFFFACLYLISNFYFLDLSTSNFFQLYFLFLGIGFLISIKKYRSKLDMSIYEYLLFNFMSFAPLLVCSTFFINNTYAFKEYSETYEIKHFEHFATKTVYHLRTEAYPEKEYLRTITQKDKVTVTGEKYLTIYFSDGLLGIRRVDHKVLE